MMKIQVIVSDLFGAAMEPMELEIEVEPKVLDGSAVDALLNDKDALSNPAVLANVMNGLLDSMKTPTAPDATAPKIDQSAIKKKMVAMIAEVKIDSPAGCGMVADTLDGASGTEIEMDDDAVQKALAATNNIAQFAEELGPEELIDIAQKSLSAASKFTSGLKGDKAAEQLKAAIESEAMLTSGSATNMVAGEAPTEIKTENGKTKVSCIDPADKNNDLGGFKLPNVGDDGDGCTGATNTAGKNRYGFSSSSKSVHGDTMGLGLSAGLGKKKKVQNLTEPIRLVMPNKDKIPKPEYHVAYCELMRVVHLVECNTNASNLILKIKPVQEKNLTGNMFVFMNKGVAPSLVDHQHNCTLPIPYPDNWVNMTSAQQEYFETEERWRCFISQSAMNETCIGRWCAGVIYYQNQTNITLEIKPRDTPVSEARCIKLNYTFYAYTRACLYWDDEEKAWSGKGCKASTETNDNQTVCYCNHLTDFGGGGPFAAPQPIDFGDAFSGFSNLGENPTVFAVVLSLIALFFLMLVWARWKDKKDLEKASVLPLPDNHPNDNYVYEVAVQTGFKSGATSTSEVFIILYGSSSESGCKQLVSPVRQCFQKGDTDIFLVAVPYSLGVIKEIEIWHNNTGVSPGWYLMQVKVTDMQMHKPYQFVCNKWLDVAEDDGLISRRIEIAHKEELVEFGFVFAQTLRKNLYDGHIWFSVFTRPPASTFTRCQRLNTCFSLLLTTMLANAMFYTGGSSPPSDAIHFGPVTISISELRIGFTSAMVVIPANLLIITLFKKAGPPKDKTAEHVEESKEDITLETDRIESNTPVSQSVISLAVKEGNNVNSEETAAEKHNNRINFFKSICFAGQEDDEKEKDRKRKKPLPHWLIYIAYFFVFVTSATSAFFVILYGFSFGKVKSDKWIISMLISFWQSVLLVQPVKVVALSILFALLVKEPEKPEENVQGKSIKNASKGSDEEDSELEEEARNAAMKKNNNFKLPDERHLEEARQQRLKEKKIKAIIREIFTHMMFLVLCLMVAYAAADPFSYSLANGVHKLCAGNGVASSYFGSKAYNDPVTEYGVKRVVKTASGIRTREEWFDWVRYSVIEYLFPNGWYNDERYLSGFVADNEASKVLAMARVRQLRVKPMSCTKHPAFKHLVKECNAAYGMASEDVDDYSAGWNPPFNKTIRYRLRRGKRKAMFLGLESPWRYASILELKNFPFFGRFAMYNGASYSVNIGPTKNVAKRIVADMKANFWVDRKTRALFTEANIYNANTNLMVIVTMLHEILPTGGWSYYTNIQSLRLYRYVGGLGSVIMLFDMAFVIVTLVGLYRSAKSIRKQGFITYIGNFWNALHFIVTFSSIIAIAFTIGRFLYVKWSVEQYTEDPEVFVSFQYVGQLEYFIMAFIGFVVFFTNLEFLRLLRFNRRVAMLTKTMGVIGSPLSSFGIMFLIVFMAYVSLAHVLFVDKLEGYQSVIRSFISLAQMFMGKFSLSDFEDNAPFFGPLLFASYMIAIQMVLINMFIGIVCDAFVEVRESVDEGDDANVVSFVSNRMKKLAGNTTGIVDESIYCEWKTDWEIMMENFNENCDNCTYLVRNMESEEIRQQKWFQPKKLNKSKRNILAGVMVSDYLLYEGELCDGIGVIEKKMKKMTSKESRLFLLAAIKKRKQEKLEEDEKVDVADGESDASSEEEVSTDEE